MVRWFRVWELQHLYFLVVMSVNELEPKYEVCRIKPAVLLINESVAMEKREREREKTASESRQMGGLVYTLWSHFWGRDTVPFGKRVWRRVWEKSEQKQFEHVVLLRKHLEYFIQSWRCHCCAGRDNQWERIRETEEEIICEDMLR